MRKALLALTLAASVLFATPAQGAGYTVTKSGKVTTVSDSQGVVARFTRGSRTATLRGAARTLGEPNVTATVASTTRLRLLAQPFNGTVDYPWMEARLTDTSPDLLELGLQYVAQAPVLTDGTGRQITGDASYGPLQPDGTRQEGSDFNDYLGVAWTYPTETDPAETAQLHALDCSGFVRMVYGYRAGHPLTLDPNGSGLPRRAAWMETGAPGNVIVANTGGQAPISSAMWPGDLVFFDASTDDGTDIDHVGIYLGVDNAGHHRFVSSRKSIDGPTMGDFNGKSILDGTGLYTTSFRSVRRL